MVVRGFCGPCLSMRRPSWCCRQTACSAILLALLLLGLQALCHTHPSLDPAVQDSSQLETSSPEAALPASAEDPHASAADVPSSNGDRQQNRSLLQSRRPTGDDENGSSSSASPHAGKAKARSLRTHRGQARADAADAEPEGDC